MNKEVTKRRAAAAWMLAACIVAHAGGCSQEGDLPSGVAPDHSSSGLSDQASDRSTERSSRDQAVGDTTAAQADASPEKPPGTAGPLLPADDLERQLEPIGYYAPGDHQPTDPVKTNGPIFVDWPRPAATVLISGEQLGYLEPCGCAGLENQKGGMKRRHTLVKQLVEHDWPLVAVDLGGQIRRYGPQAVIKFRTAIESLVEMGYQAVGFGVEDLRLRTDDLVQVAANLKEGSNPLVSANVALFNWDAGFVAQFRVVRVGGRSIGITSVLGESYQKQISNDDLLFQTPEEGLKHVLPTLREKADFLVLLAYATPEESQALARQFPDFDIVVTAGGAEEPPRTMARIDGAAHTRLVEVGHKGMYVAVLGLFDEAETPVRYQRVPLDSRFSDSAEMQNKLIDYQRELETLGLAGLGLREVAHQSGRKFVGSATCAECHTEATEVWEKTPHSHATETLVKLKPPRHFDPECLSCHVTGWDPQGYFPFAGGYMGLEKTPQLRANGCENCHGPGSAHVAAETGEVDATDDQLDALRAEMRLSLIEGEEEGNLPDGVIGKVTSQCRECHDLDNSPDFDFKTYWPKVEHHGKE